MRLWETTRVRQSEERKVEKSPRGMNCAGQKKGDGTGKKCAAKVEGKCIQGGA